MLFLFCFDFDYFAIAVVTARWADVVRQAVLAAVLALHQVGRFEGIMGAAAVAATRSMLTLRMWGHDLTPTTT